MSMKLKKDRNGYGWIFRWGEVEITVLMIKTKCTWFNLLSKLFVVLRFQPLTLVLLADDVNLVLLGDVNLLVLPLEDVNL